MNKKVISAAISLGMMLGNFSGVYAQEKVLLKNGVEVTTSSAEMNAGKNSESNGTKDSTIKRSMDWYESNQSEIKNKNTKKDSIDLVSSSSKDSTIVIDDDTTYQNFKGIGTSVDETTIYNLSKMSEEKRLQVLRQIVDPVEGEGMTLFRLPIGSSDYTHVGQDFYTYYDVKDVEKFSDKIENPDWYNTTGNGFSIQIDRDLGIIDTIHDIQKIAKECGVEDEISFFASPWSLPGWMKNYDANGGKMDLSSYFGLPAGSYFYDIFANQPQYKDRQELIDTRCWGLVGGTLDDECIDDAAMYFKRYLEEYEKEGIKISGITLQNEPGQVSGYSSGEMTGSQQAKLSRKIKNLIKDTSLENVKIYGIDYNAKADGSNSGGYTGAVDYFKDIINTDASSIDGVALHDYSAGKLTVSAAKEINDLDSSKEIFLSERSLWGTYGMNRIVSFLRNNMTGYCSWVTMADDQGGSQQMGSTPDPTLFIQSSSDSNDVRAMPEVYMLGQFTKYIRPGYVRVDSTDSVGENDYGISNVVFKDENTGKLVMVVVNNSDEDQTFTTTCDDYQFTATIEATNVATYTWNPNDIDKEAPTIEGNDATVEVGNKDSVEKILNLKVTDNKDENIQPVITTDFDANKVGKYNVNVKATDQAGNTAEKEFTITVKEKAVKTDAKNQDSSKKDSQKTKSVKTGDDTNILGLCLLGIMSLFVLLKKYFVKEI